MGCNCGKAARSHQTRRYPFSPQGETARKDQAVRDARTAQEKIPDTGDKDQTASYQLVDQSGHVESYGSLLEANAARVRAGYRGVVRRQEG